MPLNATLSRINDANEKGFTKDSLPNCVLNTPNKGFHKLREERKNKWNRSTEVTKCAFKSTTSNIIEGMETILVHNNPMSKRVRLQEKTPQPLS